MEKDSKKLQSCIIFTCIIIIYTYSHFCVFIVDLGGLGGRYSC